MIEAVERYIDMRSTLGYHDQDLKRALRKFAKFAAGRGAVHLRRDDIICWVDEIPSSYQKRRHLDWIEKLGHYLSSEDEVHESMPARYASGLGKRPIHQPYIYSDEEICRIMGGFNVLSIKNNYDIQTYSTLIGLIAATGMRISEALALKNRDLKGNEVFIRKAKYGKDRMIIIDDTVVREIERYVHERPEFLKSDKLFVNISDKTPTLCTVNSRFRQCLNALGIKGNRESGPPRIHDLRHTFAVNSLRECGNDESEVWNHMVYLSTYLGHVSVKDTYWYLRLLPEAKLEISKKIAGML